MNKFTKRLVIALALLFVAVVAFGCSNALPAVSAASSAVATSAAPAASAAAATEAASQSQASTATDQTGDLKGKTIAVSFMSLNNPFWVAENATLKSEIEARGGTLVTYDAQLNLSRQISQIEDAVSSGVSGVFVSPYDWKGIRPALEACNSKKVPIVVIDTKVFDANLVNTQVVSDNVLGGKLCAENLAKAIGGKGNIAVIDLSTNMAVQDRDNGFDTVMKNYPDIKVVAREDGDGSVEKALPIMEDILQAHPDIVGVFGTNDPAAIGAIAALESAGKLKNVTVVGIDGAKDACQLITDGKMLGTAAQYPSQIAKECVNQMSKILAGQKPDKDIIYISESWVSKDNVDEYQKTNSY